MPFIAAVVSLAVLATSIVHAHDVNTTSVGPYYVSTSGSDFGTGSVSAPWRSLQHAVSNAPAGSTINVAAGQYSPFTVRVPDLKIVGAGRTSTVVVGNSASRDVIAVQAARTAIRSVGVSGCVPKVVPGEGYENAGASGIAITSGGDGSSVLDTQVAGKTALNEFGLNFACFGISLRDVRNVTVDGSDISGSGLGLFIRHAGSGIRATNNRIHDNHAMIRNTIVGGDDFGGIAVSLNKITDSPGPTVASNVLYNNFAPSHDYGVDGGGFDIYGASNVTMDNNTIYNNVNIVETGGDTGDMCSNNVFSNNIASGRSSNSGLTISAGLLLRCGSHMHIVNNRISNVDWWTFAVSPAGGNVASLSGLTVTGNTIVQGYDLVWSLTSNPAGGNFKFSPNTYTNRGYLARDWRGTKYMTPSPFLAAIGQ